MRRIYFGLIFLILSFLLIRADSFAHVYQQSDTISAALHLDPEEDTPAGKEVTVEFELTDSSRMFKVQDCDCSVEIVDPSKKIIYSHNFDGGDVNSQYQYLHTSFVFPKEGEYVVRLFGKPKETAQFHPFVFEFKTPIVKGQAETVTQTSSRLQFDKFAIPAILVLIVGIGTYLVLKRKKTKK